MAGSDIDRIASEAIAAAPLPTPKTLRRRNSVFFQLLRFIAINVRMIRVILRGHG